MMKKMNKPFVLIGAGGHGMVIAEILEAMGERIACFTDDHPLLTEQVGYTVIQNPEALDDTESKQFIISIGNNAIRKKMSIAYPLEYGTALHPSAQLSSRATIGEGTVVMAGVCVNSSARIGKHCILNTLCSIDHECVLEDFVHISPGAALAGNVKVGEGTHIGIGASVIPGVTIGKWCTIGAGAVVLKDVPDHSTVVGVPGKVIKTKAHE